MGEVMQYISAIVEQPKTPSHIANAFNWTQRKLTIILPNNQYQYMERTVGLLFFLIELPFPTMWLKRTILNFWEKKKK